MSALDGAGWRAAQGTSSGDAPSFAVLADEQATLCSTIEQALRALPATEVDKRKVRRRQKEKWQKERQAVLERCVGDAIPQGVSTRKYA